MAKIRVGRKYSLDRIGQRYETITIEVDGDGSAEELINKIEQAYQAYIKLIKEKVVT